MAGKDYYKILGIAKGASKDEIKKAYRRLAHEHHPDKGGDQQKFKEINEAYQVLGDDTKRAQYDQFGSAFDQQGRGGYGGQGPFGGFDFSSQGGNFQGFDFGGFEDVFESFFGGGGGGARQAKRGQRKDRGADVVVSLPLTFMEAALGVKKDISFSAQALCKKCSGSGQGENSKQITCKTCNGKGHIEQVRNTMFGAFRQAVECEKCSGTGKILENPCTECKGEGRIKEIKKVSVNIPGGIEDGQTVKMSSAGSAGLRSAASGDLYIKVSVSGYNEHGFERRGPDIYYTRQISYSQAVLGDKVDVPTIHGEVKLKIPAGIESGTVLRIAGKGASRMQGFGNGDMYVKIVLKVPKNISRKAKQLLEELKNEGV